MDRHTHLSRARSYGAHARLPIARWEHREPCQPRIMNPERITRTEGR
jgi:hypothetical protein